MNESHEITQMLHEWSEGNQRALADLMPLVYDELHRQAARFLRRERPDHTLQATALIHEAYIKLIDTQDLRFNSRAHFYAIAANIMRRILVDHARAKNRAKRGGNAETLQFDEGATVIQNAQSVDLIALDEALTRLADNDPQQARIVELRYFGGLTLEETAESLRMSRTTVASDWAMAKAWLRRELSK